MAEKKTPSYKDLSSELEGILEQMRSGELDLEETIAKYQRGKEITKLLEDLLKAAQTKINNIK